MSLKRKKVIVFHFGKKERILEVGLNFLPLSLSLSLLTGCSSLFYLDFTGILKIE